MVWCTGSGREKYKKKRHLFKCRR